MNKHTSIQFQALPPDTCLHDTYIIKGILGEGGFGITYDGCRTGDGLRVAIKEYFPRQIALRTEQDGLLFMQPFPEKYAETYDRGRKRFLNEAETLRHLEHLDNIVSIYDSFEEKGTAYIVMEYIDGPTLGQFVLANGILAFPELMHLADPLIRALSEVHRQGIIHRDISPDNLILGLDNKLHLIDFGAVTHDNPDGGKNTVILKAGYAPPEQYISNSSLGAWVDVYALCATMYFALTGNPPCEAMHRLDSETEESLPGLEHLLPGQRAAIEKGLQLRSANRFHDMEELHDALITAEEGENAKTHLGSILSRQDRRRLARLQRPGSVRRNIAAAGLSLLLILAGLLILPQVFHYYKVANKNISAETASDKKTSADIASGQNTPAKNTDSQNPPAEETSSGNEVPAAVSSSPETAATPGTLSEMINVSGMTLKKGKQALKKLDKSIQIKTTYQYSNSVPAKHIIRQSIAPGTSFSKGRIPSILLTVSKGRKPAKPTATKKPAATKRPAATKPSSSSKSKNNKKKDYDVKGDSDYTTIPLE